MNLNLRNTINLLSNQALWFICVIGGDYWAMVCGLAYFLFYVYFIGHIKNEWRSLLLIAVLGFSVDMLLSSLGTIHFASSLPLPVWLFILWVSFASLMHHGLQWLQSRRILSILLGSSMGPFSYYAGTLVSENHIEIPLAIFVSVYGIIWAMFMPIFLTLVNCHKFTESGKKTANF